MRYCPDEPLCVAFHPSGNQLLVGFSDKLRMFNLLMDDVRQVRAASRDLPRSPAISRDLPPSRTFADLR